MEVQVKGIPWEVTIYSIKTNFPTFILSDSEITYTFCVLLTAHYLHWQR